MKVTCYSCGKILGEPGAVLIGPPLKNNKDNSILTVHKYHLCLTCWPDLIKNLDNLDEARKANGNGKGKA